MLMMTKVKILKQCEYISFSQDDKFNVNDGIETDMFVVDSGKIKVCMGSSVVVVSIVLQDEN